LNGEIITDAEPVIGYLHRGWEKMMENRDYHQIVPLADRLCYASSLSWCHMYCRTVEELMELEVPERAKWLRVLTLEIQRLASHLMWLAAIGTDLGSYTMYLYPMRERELFMDLMTELTGARMTTNYPRIGGVRNDLPPNFERDTLRALILFEKKLREYETLFDECSAFLMRTQGIGKLTSAQAINLGITGPTLRGCNVDFDVRRDDPYETYGEIDFRVCSHPDCDSYARYRVRIDEMYESCNIIRTCFKMMKAGPVRVKSPKTAPAGHSFVHEEDPRGEGLMYLIGDGTDKPFRLKVRSPIFVSVSAMPAALIGEKVADVPSIMGMVDMCLGETDR
jgi:NADH-quinone oxidoreductase subunit D